MENMEDDFETVCDIARRGDGTILEEAKKASTILFFNYNWSIEDIVADLASAPVEHLVRLQHRCTHQPQHRYRHYHDHPYHHFHGSDDRGTQASSSTWCRGCAQYTTPCHDATWHGWHCRICGVIVPNLATAMDVAHVGMLDAVKVSHRPLARARRQT